MKKGMYLLLVLVFGFIAQEGVFAANSRLFPCNVRAKVVGGEGDGGNPREGWITIVCDIPYPVTGRKIKEAITKRTGHTDIRLLADGRIIEDNDEYESDAYFAALKPIQVVPVPALNDDDIPSAAPVIPE